MRAFEDRSATVDALRGAAALAVMLHHLPRPAAAPFAATWWATLPMQFGYLGVILFLVLSGYCIHFRNAQALAAGRLANVNWRDFFRRRVLRLYPAYLAALVITAVFSFPALRTAPAEQITGDLVSHLTFSHNLTRDYCLGWFNVAMWTVGLEFQLYLLYPVYLAARRRWPAGRVLLIAGSISAVWLFGTTAITIAIYRTTGTPVDQQSIGPIGRWSFWPIGYWFAWVLGAVAAEYAAGTAPALGRLFQWKTIIFAVCLTLLVSERTLWTIVKQSPIIGWHGGRYIKDFSRCIGALTDPIFAVACAAIIINFTRWRIAQRWLAPLSAIGLASYSLCLTHVPMIDGLNRLWTGPPTVGKSLLISAACIGLGFLCYRLVEGPCLRALRRPRAAGTATALRRAA
jgi:peptidoglycan/LPS O-acetylase OafA/YrhL